MRCVACEKGKQKKQRNKRQEHLQQGPDSQNTPARSKLSARRVRTHCTNKAICRDERRRNDRAKQEYTAHRSVRKPRTTRRNECENRSEQTHCSLRFPLPTGGFSSELFLGITHIGLKKSFRSAEEKGQSDQSSQSHRSASARTQAATEIDLCEREKCRKPRFAKQKGKPYTAPRGVTDRHKEPELHRCLL